MNGGTGNSNESADGDDQVEREFDETVVLTEEPDDTGDTAEFNVDELVAKLEATDESEVEKRCAIRRRLEELQDEIGDNLDSTYNINLDED